MNLKGKFIKIIGGLALVVALVVTVVGMRSASSHVAILEDKNLEAFSDVFSEAFQDLDISITSSNPIKPRFGIRQKVNASSNRLSTVSYLKDGLTVTARYDDLVGSGLKSNAIKQTVTLNNPSEISHEMAITTKTILPTDSFVYEGESYAIGASRQKFAAQVKTAPVPEYARDVGAGSVAGIQDFANLQHTYTVGSKLHYETFDGSFATYDWADIADQDHEVNVYREGGDSIMAVTVRVLLAPFSSLEIDPVFRMDDTSNYSARYSGAAGDSLGDLDLGAASSIVFANTVRTGDLDNDGRLDLVLAAPQADNGGTDTGSIYVLLGSLLDQVSGTGNNINLDVASNFSIRYDGGTADDVIGGSAALGIGDVNGDGESDLVFGAANTIGESDDGSTYVILSTLIKTQSGVVDLSDSGSYNILYSGSGGETFSAGGITIGDVNGDGINDLAISSPLASSFDGYVYVFFSTLIDDVGVSTGNSKPLSTSSNYNIRYNGTGSFGAIYVGQGRSNGDVNGDGLSDLIIGSLGGQGVWVMFSTLIDDVGATTGNNNDLATGTSYNIMYSADSADIGESHDIGLGDMNGDGLGDLIIGDQGSSKSASDSGSVYILYSTLVDNYTGTANDVDLDTTTNFNVRFDGAAASDELSFRFNRIGDLNGDGRKDLLIYAEGTDDIYVIFSTLLDSFGSGVGVTRDLDTAANYSAFNDASSDTTDDAVSGENLKEVKISDVNNDGKKDLVIGSGQVDNNGSNSGSVFIFHSTVFEAMGTGTGNTFQMSDASNRYDGASAGDELGNDVLVADVIGDSNRDLITVATEADVNGTDSGAAYIVLGTIDISDTGASTIESGGGGPGDQGPDTYELDTFPELQILQPIQTTTSTRPVRIKVRPGRSDVQRVYVRYGKKELPLYDDGKHGDGRLGDGIYSTDFVNFSNTTNFFAYAKYASITKRAAGIIKVGDSISAAPIIFSAFPAPIPQINQLFRLVFMRTPSIDEWTFWASRVLSGEKTTADALLGAMQWRKIFSP